VNKGKKKGRGCYAPAKAPIPEICIKPSLLRYLFLFGTHHHNGAVGVPYHGIGDASHQSPPYPLAPPTAETSPKIVGRIAVIPLPEV
jgi:hypothetical protein